jgi:YD repeat-containing protein
MRYEYDAAGRLAAVTENATGGAQTHAQDVRTIYGYDALGNRTHVTNALGHTSVYTYDAMSQRVAEADPLGHTSVYTYDLLGQQTFVQDADGTVVSYTHDAAGRVTAIHYPTSSVRYLYDRVGNRTTMTVHYAGAPGCCANSLGTTTYTYDALYRLRAAGDPLGAVVRYTYDAAGNRTGLVYPSGETVTYTYDALNRLVQVEDWAG